MRTTACIALFGLLAGLLTGCSMPRMNLTRSEPPKVAPEERVSYGFPWSKKKTPAVASSGDASNQELPKDLQEQLAKSRASTLDRKGNLTEILQRAAGAESRGDLDSARAAYLEVVSAQPNHAEAHHRLGVIADMNQDSMTADEHYAKAYAANPKNADLLSDMGYSYYLRGRMDLAESRLKEALDANQHHRSAQTNLGLVYGKQGKYDQSLAMFRLSGTESEAQKNIAALFPNGRPTSNVALASATDLSTVPLPVTQDPAPGVAPPFPEDKDSRNGLGTKTPASPLTPGAGMPEMSRNTALAITGTPSNPWGVAGNAAAYSPGASNIGAPAGPAGVQPQSSVVSTPQAGSPVSLDALNLNPGIANSPAAPRADGTELPVMAAKTADPSDFWQGGLPAGTATGATSSQGMSQPPTNSSLAALQWPGMNSAPNSPAQSASWGQPSPTTDPARSAAQMALMSGPGALFPAYGQSPSGAIPSTTAPPARSWGQSSSPPSAQNWGNELGNNAGMNQSVNPANYSAEWPTQPIEQLSNSQIAPNSPWGAVEAPRTWADTWPATSPSASAGANQGQNGNGPSAWPASSQQKAELSPPAGTTGAALYAPRESTPQPWGNVAAQQALPTVTPGPASLPAWGANQSSAAPQTGGMANPGYEQSLPGSRQVPGWANEPARTNGAQPAQAQPLPAASNPTTVPNWPYAPARS